MKTRQRKSDDYAFLKAACRRLVGVAGGVESASLVSRVNKSAFGDYQNPLATATYMPIDVVADLEADTGMPIVTEALVKLAGGYMVKLPPISHQGLFASQLSVIGREMGDIFERASLALSDGTVSPDESRRIIIEITEAISALAQARGTLERQQDGV